MVFEFDFEDSNRLVPNHHRTIGERCHDEDWTRVSQLRYQFVPLLERVDPVKSIPLALAQPGAEGMDS